MIAFEIFKSNWTFEKRKIINLDFKKDFLILILKNFSMIDLRDFKIKEVGLLIFKLLKTFSVEKRIFWEWNSSLFTTIRKMKEDSKNARRKKLINLTENYKVSLDIISICVKIFKININIIFKRPEFKLA